MGVPWLPPTTERGPGSIELDQLDAKAGRGHDQRSPESARPRGFSEASEEPASENQLTATKLYLQEDPEREGTPRLSHSRGSGSPSRRTSPHHESVRIRFDDDPERHENHYCRGFVADLAEAARSCPLAGRIQRKSVKLFEIHGLASVRNRLSAHEIRKRRSLAARRFTRRQRLFLLRQDDSASRFRLRSHDLSAGGSAAY